MTKHACSACKFTTRSDPMKRRRVSLWIWSVNTHPWLRCTPLLCWYGGMFEIQPDIIVWRHGTETAHKAAAPGGALSWRNQFYLSIVVALQASPDARWVTWQPRNIRATSYWWRHCRRISCYSNCYTAWLQCCCFVRWTESPIISMTETHPQMLL